MNLMRFKKLYFAISLLFLIPGIYALFAFGLKPGIDFTGGSLLEISLNSEQEITREKTQELVGEIYEVSSVQAADNNSIIIRGKDIDNDQKNLVLEKLEQNFGELTEQRFETVGPILGKELLRKTIIAIIIVSTLILLYVAKQFSELKYGVSAILAMFHDSLILLGAFSIFGHFWGVEVDVLFVTALLTTLSFSVHDTIVVYDRIRELKKKHSSKPFIEIANAAVLETLSRSINNSVTIIIMLLSLALMGGETIKWFSVALLIGAVTGTYSSTFTAVPLLLVWENKFKKK
jgi:preprotein translocase subunit SecF